MLTIITKTFETPHNIRADTDTRTRGHGHADTDTDRRTRKTDSYG